MLAGVVSLSAEAPKGEVAVALSGEASFTFGIEIGTSTIDAGIVNAQSSDLTVTLVAEGTDAKGGKEGEEVYGWIELGSFKAILDDDDGTTVNGSADHISAKLFLGPVFIDVLGDDDTIDEAGDILGATTVAPVVTLSHFQVTGDDATPADDFGIHIGLKDTSVVEVVLGVASATTYVGQANYDDPATTATSEGAWNFFAKVGLKAVPDLTVEGLFNMSTDVDSDMSVGGKVGYAIAVAEGFKLGVTGAVDVVLADTTDLQFTGELTFAVPGDGLTDEDYFGATDIDIKSGLDVIFTLASATTSAIDLGVYFYDSKLIPVIDLFAAFEISDLGATGSITGIGVRASASIEGGIAPFAEFYTKSNSTTTLTQILKVGVDLTMVTNTTFTLAFTSGDMADDTDEVGTIEFTTKIAY
jgi:hypothetical protein